MTIITLDYETRSPVDLKVHGLDRYSAHADTRVLMVAYRVDNGPLRHAEIGARGAAALPAELRDGLLDPNVEKWAFNAQFERVITRRVLRLKTPYTGWRCTMVLGFMLSFTGTLGDMGAQVGLPPDRAKDADGKRLIRLFCGPQKPTKNQPKVWIEPGDRPDDWAKFIEYNKQDVIAEEALRELILPVLLRTHRNMPWEWHLYEIDQRINDRGLPVDAKFARSAMHISDLRKRELAAQLKKLTGLANPNSVPQLLGWLRARGYPFNDLAKDTVKKVLAETVSEEASAQGQDGFILDDDAVEALKLRQWASRTSTRKLKTLLDAMDEERGVCRFLYQFGGASRTNRWAGRRVQTQNLARTPKALESDDNLRLISDAIRDGDSLALELFSAEPMEMLVGTVRSVFRTPEGTNFTVCDLSSIESCVIGWLTKCVRLLNVFRQGLDPYKDFAQELYGVTYDAVTKAQRTDSKPAVLGAGYRLGGGELTDEGKKTGLWGYAENMGINLSREQSHKAVRLFRETYREIPKFWFDVEDAVADCVTTGAERRVSYLRFNMVNDFLVMTLPSGRPIYYHKPRMVQRKWQDGTPRKKLSFTYMGQEQKTGQWVRLENHGGRFTEQSVQGIARDVLAVGIRRAHEAGFDIRGHVHDEIKTLTRERDNQFTVEFLRELMTQEIKWAPGLPLGAAGWTGPIYKKD